MPPAHDIQNILEAAKAFALAVAQAINSIGGVAASLVAIGVLLRFFFNRKGQGRDKDCDKDPDEPQE